MECRFNCKYEPRQSTCRPEDVDLRFKQQNGKTRTFRICLLYQYQYQLFLLHREREEDENVNVNLNMNENEGGDEHGNIKVNIHHLHPSWRLACGRLTCLAIHWLWLTTLGVGGGDRLIKPQFLSSVLLFLNALDQV